MAGKLKIEYARTADLAPYAGNAKEHPEWQVEQIANSIEEFGFNDPIAVWRDAAGIDEIVEGHGRLLAAKLLGMETVPVIRLDELTDDKRRAYTLVHNQLTLNTGWDFEALEAEMATLDFDFDELGFADFVRPDEDEALETVDDVEEVPALAPGEAETRVQPGEIWALGDHRLMCGDSTDPGAVDKLMGGVLARLLLTDPPYNVALGSHDSVEEARQLHRRTDGLLIANDSWGDEAAFVEFLLTVYRNALDHMSPGAAFYIWHASNQAYNFLKACEQAGMQVRQTIIWDKSSFTLGRQDYQWKHEPCLYGWKDGAAHYFCSARNEPTVLQDVAEINPKKMSKDELVALVREMLSDKVSTTVIDEDKPSRSEEHPTMKPIRLMARQIRNSTRKGETVLDVFGGSGSTLVACEQMGRTCYTMELDPKFCDVILRRWEDLTGREAVKVVS